MMLSKDAGIRPTADPKISPNREAGANTEVPQTDAAVADFSADYSIILDNSATVGSLPFGVNVLTITGIPCDSCLLSSSSERPVS